MFAQYRADSVLIIHYPLYKVGGSDITAAWAGGVEGREVSSIIIILPHYSTNIKGNYSCHAQRMILLFY